MGKGAFLSYSETVLISYTDRERTVVFAKTTAKKEQSARNTIVLFAKVREIKPRYIAA